jgi:pimeloyl-ACP methyl ester carboxylesterase
MRSSAENPGEGEDKRGAYSLKAYTWKTIKGNTDSETLYNTTMKRMKMYYQTKKTNNWFFLILAVLVIIGALVAPIKYSHAIDIVTNDYFLNHKSIESIYKEKNLDPTVLIHVREVVLKGRERTAPAEGKVLLLAHGASTPGYIGFDGSCKNCSMMRYFALAGWDTFALDYEGFGMSTRSPVVDMPALFPESQVPTVTDVAVGDIERVVDFVCNLRGVEKVSLFGWSFGAIRSAPIYTIRHPEKVAKLVLFAGAYGGGDEKSRKQAKIYERMKVLTTMPSMEGWIGFGGKEENFHPGALEAYRDAILASDPKSGELGGKFRFPAGPLVDIYLAEIQFDASKITVPTLVIRGANDIVGSPEDNKQLLKRLGSKVKKFVEIPEGSHYIFYEKANAEFFNAVKDFLEAKAE